MSSVFIIDNTDGSLSLTMPPGSLNGPGSGTRDSDLRLYGMGTLLWGEGVNENILRISENWACEEKAASPGTPQDETDIGPGKGITTPLIGQAWYNKTTGQPHFYNGTAWRAMNGLYVADDPYGNPNIGDMWYDTAVIGVNCMEPVLKIYDPAHPQTTPQGWVIVGSDRLSECGGPMSGDIDMTTNGILNLAYPVDPGDAANKQYVDDVATSSGGVISSHATDMTLHLTTAQNQIVDNLEANLAGHPPATMGIDLSRMKGYSAYSGNAVSTDMTQRIRKNATDTMTAGQTIVLGRNPTSASMEAATASWVESELGAIGAGVGDRLVKYWNTQATGGAGALDGDIHTSGGVVYIRVAGTWEQVFPAQYS